MVKAEEIKSLAERQPFRPFALRLNDGVQSAFNEPRNLGAPEDYHVIIFFRKSEWVPIDTDRVAEIIAR